MPKKKSKTSKKDDDKEEKKEEEKKEPSTQQKHNQDIFKKGVRAYKEYKKNNPNGTKKLATFIKEAFGKK